MTAMLSMLEVSPPSPSHPDLALLYAIAEGQKGAMTQFILRYQAFLKSQCRRLTGGNAEEASDLFSLVLLKICSERPEQFRQIHHPGGWLVRIAKNKSIDMQRSRQAEERRGRELAQNPDTAGRHARSPEQSLLVNELVGQIQIAFDQLPARLRLAAELRLIDEVSYEIIATTLGISKVNARKRVQEARRCLAHTLQRYLGQESSQQMATHLVCQLPESGNDGRFGTLYPAWDEEGAEHA